MGKINLFGREILSWESRSATSPISSIKNPQEWLQQLLGLFTSSGISVSPETALTLPVYYAGLKVIGEDIAKISGGVFKKEGINRIPVNHQSGDLLFTNPSKIINSFHWRLTMIIHAISWGNGYSLVIRDGNARPIELRLIEKPIDVEPYVIDNELWYRVHGFDNPFRPEDVFHIRGIGYNGIKGRPLLHVAKEIIGGGLASQNYSNNQFVNGLKKVALVPAQGSTKGIDPDVEKHLKSKWIEDNKKNEPHVLAPGLEVKEVGLNPSEVQLIEQQEFTVRQFSRMTRIPPHKLMDLANAHFNNIEHQSTEYVMDTLLPWIIQFELEAKNKLLTEKEKVDHYFKFNINSLMRGDSAARSAFYHGAVLDGWMNRNEVRALEDMNPAEGLEQFMMPVNVYTDEMVDLVTKKLAKEIKNNKKDGN